MNSRKRKSSEKGDGMHKLQSISPTNLVMTNIGDLNCDLKNDTSTIYPRKASEVYKVDELNKINIPSYQLVILIQQYLSSHGFCDAASILSRQSNVQYNNQISHAFCTSIINGEFHQAISYYDQISQFEDDFTKRKIKRIILEHFYYEILLTGNYIAAFRLLRNEINYEAKSVDSESSMRLITPIIYPQTNNVDQKYIPIDSNTTNARNTLLATINALSPNTVCIDDNRLEILLKYSLLYQLEKCPMHSSIDIQQANVSLFRNHFCESDEIPSQLTQIIDCHKDHIWHVEFSHNGHQLAACSKDRQLIVYHETTLNRLFIKKKVFKFQNIPFMFKWSPNDLMILLITTNGKCVVYICKIDKTSPNDVTFNASAANENVTCCDWFPDNLRYAIGSLHGNISVLNIDGTLLSLCHGYRVNCLRVTHDGASVIFGDQLKRIMIWNIRTSDTKMIYQEQEVVTNINLCPDPLYFIFNIKGSANQLFSILHKAVIRSFVGVLQTSSILNCSFRPGNNSKIFASGSENGRVYFWHLDKSEPIKVIVLAPDISINSVSWNPIDPYTLVSGGDDNHITVWRSKLNFQ